MASGSMPTDKLVVFGEHREDCTALINQFTLNHFVPTYDPTIGDDSFRVQAVIDGKPSLIEVLSTAGQEEYTALRDQYIRDGDGFLVVYSITSRKSFHAVTHYIDQIERVKSPNSQTSIYKAVSLRIMLVGNRCDRVTEREISTQEGYIFAKEHGIDFVEASAKNCINVEKAFYDVVRELRKQRAAAALLVASASALSKPIQKKSRNRSGLVKIIAERFSRLRHSFEDSSPEPAVFKGDPDQIRTVAEQGKPEYEPEVDDFRGGATPFRSRPRRKTQRVLPHLLPPVHPPGLSPFLDKFEDFADSGPYDPRAGSSSSTTSSDSPSIRKHQQAILDAFNETTTFDDQYQGTGRLTPNFSTWLPPPPPPGSKPTTNPKKKMKSPLSAGVSYVQALFDYDADDQMSLSFREGDVIQVISQLESGWWDGVFKGVRGWFPSNYCMEIAEPIGENSPDESEYSTSDSESTHTNNASSSLIEGAGLRSATQISGADPLSTLELQISPSRPPTPNAPLHGPNSQDWPTPEGLEDPRDSGSPIPTTTPRNEAAAIATDLNGENQTTESKEQHEAEFWMPQATPNGRLYYFDTLTGVSAVELPLETPSTNTYTLPNKGTGSLKEGKIEDSVLHSDAAPLGDDASETSKLDVGSIPRLNAKLTPGPLPEVQITSGRRVSSHSGSRPSRTQDISTALGVAKLPIREHDPPSETSAWDYTMSPQVYRSRSQAKVTESAEENQKNDGEKLAPLKSNNGIVRDQGAGDSRYLGSHTGVSFSRIVAAAVKYEQSKSATSIQKATPNPSNPLGLGKMELPLETGTQTTRDGPERQVFRNIQHEDYESPRDVPYRHIDVLGNGHYGFVDEVEAKSQQADGSTAVTYARKTILVQKARSAETTRRIRNEIDIMKRLDHEHVIRIAATYTVGNRFAILMQPVATMNLAEYMDRHPKPASDSPMRCWFGCLASSLAYLHSERIKHRDIKPANILIKGATIILTDFGIAHDVQDDLTSSTVGTVDSKTPMYCAPEVADEKRRGRAADIFSLGCVFLEMATVLLWKHGVSLTAFHDFKQTPEGRKAFHVNLDKTVQWIIQLFQHAGRWSNQGFKLLQTDDQLAMLCWCYAMLQPRSDDRISAPDLVLLTNAEQWTGECCRHRPKFTSPWSPPSIFNPVRSLESFATESNSSLSGWESYNTELGYTVPKTPPPSQKETSPPNDHLPQEIRRSIEQYIAMCGRQRAFHRDLSGDEYAYECIAKCGYRTNSRDHWKLHEETHQPQEFYICGICKDKSGEEKYVVFGRRKELLFHIRHEHPDQDAEGIVKQSKQDYVAGFKRNCEFCGDLFITWDSRNEHILAHFDRRNFQNE